VSLERNLKTAGLAAGPILGLSCFAINPGGHPPEARRLLAILVLAICFWVTEAIPLPATALLAAALAIVTGVAPARTVLAPFADPVIFLFVGSFLLSEAFRKYGLDRRIAGRMLRSRRFGGSPRGLMSGFGLASAGISTCLSNTATAALMTPIAVGATRDGGGDTKPRSWAPGVLLMVAYGASVGGMATLIGTPPNLLVAGFIERLSGVKVSFADWLLFGIPISAVLLILSILWTRTSAARHASSEDGAFVAAPPPAGDESPADRRGRRFTMLAFGLAAFLWTLPALLGLALGRETPMVASVTALLPESAVALLCACLLFLAPIDWRRRRFAMSWEEGREVNWGIILLFGGGLALGTLAESTGIARWAGEAISRTSLAATPAGLLGVSIATAIVISEFASNTAAATLVVPMVIAAAQAAGFDPVRPALGAGLAATCGFIFPVSSPPNAIVFGTGLVPLPRMIRTGLLLDISSFLVIWLGMLALTPLLPR